jgi:hypothetical protein
MQLDGPQARPVPALLSPARGQGRPGGGLGDPLGSGSAVDHWDQDEM